MLIAVIGSNFASRAQPLLARVGRQRVTQISVSPDRSGFSGILVRTPATGDRLYIQYLGGPEIRTNIVYRRTPSS